MFKLVIVGASSVGKSSLLRRFADDEFHETYISTIGVDFRFKYQFAEDRSLTVGDKAVKLQLWDTAGQERFRGLANSYFKGAHAVLLVYDVHNKDSFREVKDYWFGEVPCRSTQLQQHMDHKENVYVLVNKCDDHEERLSKEELDFMEEHRLRYYLVSAKTGAMVHRAI